MDLRPVGQQSGPGDWIAIHSAWNSKARANSQFVSVTTPAIVQFRLASPAVTATLLSSTTASLNWNAIPGALGYRIYLVSSNGQRLLLGVFGARTTAVEIVGLTPGSTTSFMVEAFNRTAVADSAVVPVTTPATVADSGAISNRRRGWWMN